MSTKNKNGEERRLRVEEILMKGIDYRNQKVTQFDLPSYYRANIKDPNKPIITQKGLQNYSSLKFGDNRLFYDQSFSQDIFSPLVKINEKDYGLSEEQIKMNLKRDYDYALSKTPYEDLDLIERTMKQKFKERSKMGMYQLKKTFKYFDRDGSGGIDFAEIRWAFENLGFTFTDVQIHALFAQLDVALKGEIDYNMFIQMLMEKDFEENKASWLPKKHEESVDEEKQHMKDRYNTQHQEDIQKKELQKEIEESKNFEKEMITKLFNNFDKSGKGSLTKAECTDFLKSWLGYDKSPCDISTVGESYTIDMIMQWWFSQ